MDAGGGQEIQNGGRSRSRQRTVFIGGAIALFLMLLTIGAIALVLIVGAVETGGAAASPITYEEEYISGEGPDKIAVVPVEGLISSADTTTGGVAPTTTPQGLSDALRQAEEDDSVKAVMLEINSPGGEVTASDQMHQSILDFKESSGKPVVVSMGPTAASGGYYVSTAADSIVANETTFTGSLGVVLTLPDLTGTAEKLGFEQRSIKSGEFKDMGSPFQELTPEEREVFQSIIDEAYGTFVEVIVEGRSLPEERVREIADGRVYSGRQALKLGLVDELGNLESAVEIAREEAGIDEATVVRYVQTPGLFDLLSARLAPEEPEALQIMEAAGIDLSPEPKYLYLPGL